MVSLVVACSSTISLLNVQASQSGSNPNSRIRISSAKSSSPPPTPQKAQQPPSIAEIERAIGAGKFRDQDTSSSSNLVQGKNLFETVLSNTIGEKEGEVEKKLRETGEWINERAEKASRSSGKKVLEILYLWIVPLWLVLLLVAVGGVKLPFDIPGLDDLLS